MLQRTADGRYGLNATDPSAGGVELYTILWDEVTANALQAEFEAGGRLARCVFTGAPMTGPFQGYSMAQFLAEAAKDRGGGLTGMVRNARKDLSRAFAGWEIPMKEVAKWLGRGVVVQASEDNDAMEEDVSEEEASSTSEAASLSSEAAAVSGEAAAASRKRLGSDDESKKKTKKLKKKGQQSIFSFFQSTEQKEG